MGRLAHLHTAFPYVNATNRRAVPSGHKLIILFKNASGGRRNLWQCNVLGNQGAFMLRRDFVRAVVSVSIAPRALLSQQTANPAPPPPPPAPVPWTLGLNPKTPQPHTAVVDGIVETELRFFSPQQMATLTRLSDVLLPPIGNKPGAVQAETPRFIDFLIDSSPDARRKIYSGGLDWLDAESHRKFSLPFAKLSNEQSDTLLKPWLRTWMSDHPPNEPHADFVNIAHHDIREATVNSKAWSEVASVGAQEATAVGLYWSPIEPDLYFESATCSKIPAHITAASKEAHTGTTYPRQ
jgi:Gluconate 2-dehydrogenase subunit 3